MSLQMILGPAGSGKSTYVYDLITKEAAIHQDKRYFVIVPDQFTMQTQADMVAMSRPKGGIMNIDVQSFSRLAHRIFEETNATKRLVLDDTGKSLVLRKLSGDIADEIPYLYANMRREGYIHEVKSAISEFKQYGMSPENVEELAQKCEGKGILPIKLGDLKVIYEKFNSYIKDTYITSEELMDVLAKEIDKSLLIKDSVICFDGFTGFTPVQLNVLGKLLQKCDKVYITLTLEKGKENCGDKEQELFSFTAKSYGAILQTAHDCNAVIEEPVYFEHNKRFKDKPQLAFLERNIFRYPCGKYEGESDRVRIYSAETIKDEVKKIAIEIRHLISSGAQYRDIAVVIGNMPDYEYHIEKIFARMNIPVYMDKTKALVMNPFVEFTKSILQVISDDFSAESVMRLCRCGLGGFNDTSVDIFENFILKTGLKGYRRYIETWVCKKSKNDDDEAMTAIVNEVRERILFLTDSFAKAGISGKKKARVTEFVMALYECFVNANAYKEIEEYRAFFEKEADYVREKEYAQVYRITMELLEQIYNLLKDETIVMDDFIQIIESGFEEITVGTIPQSVDRVIVGDIERSRLKPVKYLFFAGVNDGAIPKKNSKCNILSDLEREYLATKGAGLAPTPAQRMYIQRFYLYSNLVKPSEGLFLSYSRMDNEGKTTRPAYLIGNMRRMFPNLSIETNTNSTSQLQDNIYSIDDLKEIVGSLLIKYSSGVISEEEKELLLSGIGSLRSSSADLLEIMINNSFYSYSGEKIDARVAGILYGEVMNASISRMELYAQCAYAYFLNYGLSLKERNLYEIDNRNMGTIFHGVLEEYGNEMKRRGISWNEADEELSDSILDTSLEKWARENGPVLFDSAEGHYVYEHMNKVIKKAVNTLGSHLKAGEFDIAGLEVEIGRNLPIDEVNAAYDVKERMKLSGKIDRLDMALCGDKTYVKIIDYKTGNKDFSLINFYHGLSLQLVVYMEEGLRKAHEMSGRDNITPAALLYYRVADETVDASEKVKEEDVDNLIMESLKTKGLVNSDMEVVRALDRDIEISGKSKVIPVALTKSGGFYNYSNVISEENMRLLGDYALYKLKNMGNEIIAGNISKNPIETDGQNNSCSYCVYKEVCGFDTRLEGYEMRERLKTSEKDNIIEMMKNELEEE